MRELIDRDEAILSLCNLTNYSDMPEEWHVGVSASIGSLYRVPTVKRNCFTCGMENGDMQYNPERVSDKVLEENDRAVSLAEVCKIIQDTYEVSPDTWGKLRELANVVERKHGEWKYHSNPNNRSYINPEDAYCSNCGCHIDTTMVEFGDYNYCPNCGSYMRGVDDGE